MSGGCWQYRNDIAAAEILDCVPMRPYAREAAGQREIVMRENPLGDAMFTEIVYDVFQQLTLLDLNRSGDLNDEIYQRYLEEFKRKWRKADG